MKYTSNYLFTKLFLAIIVFSTLITSCKQEANPKGIPNKSEVPVDSIPVDPVLVDPVLVDPVLVDPVLVDPVPVDSVPDPVPVVPKIIKIKPNEKSKYLKEIINPNTTPFKFSKTFSNKTGGFYFGGNQSSNDINIYVNPNSIKLKDGSNAPDGNYKIAMKEYFSVSDMLKAGISTMSDGKLLVTAGCFYWEIQDENGNNEYKVDNARLNFKIHKLYSKEYVDKMQFFEGKKTGKETNVVNWVNPRGFELANCYREGEGKEIIIKDCKSFFRTIGTGYGNTDAFYKIKTDKRTQFKVILSADSIHKITANKVIIKAIDYPIGAYLFSKKDHYAPYNGSIPAGMKLKIIAIGENGEGKFFLKEQVVTIAGNDTFEMELKPSSTAEIVTALK